MVLVQEIVTAANATLGANIASGKWWETSPKYRAIRKIGLVGSTAVADTSLEIFYGTEKVAEIKNTTAGAAKVPVDSDMQTVPLDKVMVPNERLMIKVNDAADTQNIVLTMEIVEFG